MEYMNLDLMQERVKKAGLFPMTEHTMLGAWMPSLVNGRLAESAFLYTAPNPLNRMKRPFAWLTLDSQSGSLLRFAFCALDDFMDPAQYPLDMVLVSVPVPLTRRTAAGGAFREAYLRCRGYFFAPEDTLSPEQVSDVQRLREAMAEALRPELKPFYDVLGSDLFRWMDRVCQKKGETE